MTAVFEAMVAHPGRAWAALVLAGAAACGVFVAILYGMEEAEQ